MARYAFVLLAFTFFSQSDLLIDRSEGCMFLDGDPQCKPCLRPGSGEPGKEIHNKPPDVVDVVLEKSELHAPPKKDDEQRPPQTNELTVNVSTTAVDPEGDVLTYNYTISGGRIIGTGANVRWDLNRVQPGTYTITAGVDDGCGICGKTMTQSIVVVQD